MLLGFKTKFSNGEPTNFKEKILSGEKIHTIRKGERWKPGMKIHFATGVRTKQCNIFKVGECISVQKIKIKHVVDPYAHQCKNETIYVTIDDSYRPLCHDDFYALCKNDGFTKYADFVNWFKEDFEGQIVHFTNKKY